MFQQIDNYQGEESQVSQIDPIVVSQRLPFPNQIVIASLTRSNEVGDIGFMAGGYSLLL